MLYVRDAGYSVSTSPSYQKQFGYQYNAFGQKVQETNLNNTVTQYSYGDLWGNFTQVVQDPHMTNSDSHLARTTAMVYDAAGRVQQSTDLKSQTSSFAYTSLGQPTSAAFPAADSTAAETISYSYGANGRTQTVTDNRGTTSLTYEAGCDRVSSVSDPVTGAVGYTYTPQGQRLTMTLPGGGTWQYAYVPSSVGNWYEIEGKDDPNAVSPMLKSITDDQGRQVEYHLDILGAPHEVVAAQVFDTNLNRIAYMDTLTTFDVSASGSTSYRWLQTLANMWNTKNQYSQQWQGATLVLLLLLAHFSSHGCMDRRFICDRAPLRF